MRRSTEGGKAIGMLQRRGEDGPLAQADVQGRNTDIICVFADYNERLPHKCFVAIK